MPDRRTLIVAAAAALAVAAVGPASALEAGQQAPAFSAPAVLAGKPFTFALADALQRGPVVLYFFPAAFSEACSIEARAFAEATPEFQALGAAVVGVTGGDIETLSRFSVKVCNGRFAVVSDPSQAIMRSYGAVMRTRPDFASRVSHLIAPDGTVLMSYENLSPHEHVDRALAALRAWSARRPTERIR